MWPAHPSCLCPGPRGQQRRCWTSTTTSPTSTRCADTVQIVQILCRQYRYCVDSVFIVQIVQILCRQCIYCVDSVDILQIMWILSVDIVDTQCRYCVDRVDTQYRYCVLCGSREEGVQILCMQIMCRQSFVWGQCVVQILCSVYSRYLVCNVPRRISQHI